MLTMLGIPNCDTVKKARTFLDARGVSYTFRDLRKQPLDPQEWLQLIESDRDGKLINTRSPSFRATGIKAADLDQAQTRLQVLQEQPTAMKRPAMIKGGELLSVGFSEAAFEVYT